jgi:hypothetical protein
MKRPRRRLRYFRCQSYLNWSATDLCCSVGLQVRLQSNIFCYSLPHSSQPTKSTAHSIIHAVLKTVYTQVILDIGRPVRFGTERSTVYGCTYGNRNEVLAKLEAELLTGRTSSTSTQTDFSISSSHLLIC